jgi:hypothetical protein
MTQQPATQGNKGNYYLNHNSKLYRRKKAKFYAALEELVNYRKYESTFIRYGLKLDVVKFI